MKQFSEFAEIYDELFSVANDYKKEVDFYDKILKKNSCKSILEVGCGCGHRGKYFIDKGYSYMGSDISPEMLKIAKRKYPKIKFIVDDIRKLKIYGKFDAILFLGKGSVYLTKDKDVISALESLKKHAKKLIITDAFDARQILPKFKENISWSKKIGDKMMTRESRNRILTKNPLVWNRKLTYIVKEGKKIRRYNDAAVLRAFTTEEFTRFSSNAGFRSISFIKKPDTLITIAKV
jgi:SAM-dependent methyltransferase